MIRSLRIEPDAHPAQPAAWVPIGDDAPDSTASSALGGAIYKFSLAESLKKGPVVRYFFPAAFSAGCLIEAHEFAEAIPRFTALGASVVGISRDDIQMLAKFSVQACQSRSPVAPDSAMSVIKSYDAV